MYSNDGFGQGDIQPFAIHSTILSVISLLLVNIYIWLFSKVNLVIGLILAVIFSAVQTLLFVILVWLVFGPWIGAFSFPIHWCWLSGTAIANIYLLIISDNTFNIKNFGLTAGTIGFALVAIFLFNKGKDELAKQQNFDIVCLVHKPDDNKIPVIENLKKFSLTNEEAKTIIDLGLKGTFWTDKYFRISESKLISTDYPNYDFDLMKATPGAEIEFKFGNKLDSVTNSNPKIIIIMNHPMKSDFEFNEPVNSTMIIYQHSKEDKFKIKQLGEERNSKKVIIKKTDFRAFPYHTSVIVNLKGRGEFRLHGFQWLEK